MPSVSGKVQYRNPSSNYGMGGFEFANKTIEGKIHAKYLFHNKKGMATV
jgi:hypothetical protein